MKHTLRKLISRGLIGAVAAAGLAATTVQAQGKDPIKFATLLDFTAVYTFATKEYSQGQRDYIKLVNVTGGIDGHPVELIVRDHGNEPQRGIALYNQALREGAILFDFLSTPVSRALVPRALEDHVVLITMLHGRADASAGKVFPYVFPASATYWSQAAVLMKYIEEHEGGLEGKKIAFVYLDSPFGREPIPVLKTLAERKGFTLETFPYPSPGTEQAATWTDVRRFNPDHILIWGAGPSQAVSLRQAIRNGIPMEKIYSVVWLSESDMEAIRGDAAAGVKRFTAVDTGTDIPILQSIVEKVIKPGKGSGVPETVGSTYYNIGVASMAIAVQAAELALEEFGPPLTGEKLQKGFEMIKNFDAQGLMPPITITAEDHQGGGWGRVSKWNGDEWVPLSDWTHAYQDIVWNLIEKSASRFKQATTQ